MTSNIILATSLSWLSDTISWSAIGYACIAIGLIAILLSNHRYLLGYLLGGMGYWLAVEGIQSAIIELFTIEVWHSYVAALAFTWFIPIVLLTYKYIKLPTNLALKASQNIKYMNRNALTQPEKYIEHTPIYNNYKPRFHN